MRNTPPRPLLLTLAFSATLALASCGNGGESQIPFCESDVQASFDPGGDLLVPFPSDLYLIEDGSTPNGYRLDLRPENTPPGDKLFNQYPYFVSQLNQLDGFGTSAAILFAFNAEIGVRQGQGEDEVILPPQSLVLDPDQTTGAASPVVLLDIDPDSPAHGQSVPVFLEYISDEDADGRGQYYLIVEPAFPLRPKTTYAAALTNRLTDQNDHCIAPSAAMRELLTGVRVDDYGLLGARCPDAIAQLVEHGFLQDASELTAMTVFTTQSIEEELVAAAADILERASTSPPRIVPGSLEITPGSDGAALVVTGRFEADIFLAEEVGFPSENGLFVISNGRPVVQGSEQLEFELVVPEASPEHPPPHPIIIYQHGLIGHKGQDMGAKRAQARAGFASLSIDAVLHGTRAADTGWEVTNFFAIDLDSGQFDMPVLRDHFRQGYLDIVQLAELVPALAELDLLPDGAPDGTPEILAAPVYLSGHSLGAIIAGGAIGLSPRIPAANLCAGGGSLPTNLFMRSELLGYFIDMLKPPGTSDADVRRFMPILQLLVERGDPVNLARLAAATPPQAISGSAPKHVLFQEVIDDGIVPNQANEALGRALGQGLLQPAVRQVYGLPAMQPPVSQNHPTGVTAAFSQFDLDADGAPMEHSSIYADQVAQTQWIHFFTTHLDSGQAEAIDPYAALGLR